MLGRVSIFFWTPRRLLQSMNLLLLDTSIAKITIVAAVPQGDGELTETLKIELTDANITRMTQEGSAGDQAFYAVGIYREKEKDNFLQILDPLTGAVSETVFRRLTSTIQPRELFQTSNTPNSISTIVCRSSTGSWPQATQASKQS